ncbi:MAG: Xaa-Pro peptidase family protein, partial [Candidatus Brocadiaceae bacterium]
MPNYAERLAEFRRRMDVGRLDAYWLNSPANVRYLCGFTGDDSALLVGRRRSVLITDSRYVEQAEREAQADEVISRHSTIPNTIAGLCRGLDARRLALTAANLPHAGFLALREAAPSLEVLSRKTGIAERMRRRKDAEEVAAIRKALGTAQAAFSAVLPELRAGRTETWVAARLEYEMRLRGAEGAAFETICAADGRASVPHARTGDGRLTPGGVALVDWGSRVGGYCCDLTRVVCVDRIPKELHPLVEVVLEAQAAVFETLRPGNTCGEADAAGRAVIARAGYGHRFGHGIGHGVGLMVHEGPRLGPGSETVLLPGMFFTVEPGVYVPGQAGVRIEEMVLITPNGHEVLTSLPRTPEDL